MSQSILASMFRIGGAFATVALGACVFHAAKSVPIGELMAARAGISLAILVTYAVAIGRAYEMRPNRLRLHILRGLMACVAMALAFISMAQLAVTQAQTLSYLAPVLVLPIAMVVLGEQMTARKITSVVLGFCGVAFILGVSLLTGEGAVIGVAAGLGAAILIALIQVTVRAMTAQESTLSIAVSFTTIVAVLSSFTILFGSWAVPDLETTLSLLGAGIFGALNVLFFAEALKRAPASQLAPLDYTGLPFALTLDWVFFSIFPSGLALIGVALITLSALTVVLQRQRRPEKA